jgi:uncharacterized protein YjdB
VYALDPTIILDNIEVNLGSTAQHYGIITPTDTLVWKPNLAVSGISISPATMAVIVGETGQLRAYLSPASATNTSVCWKSSNTAIATVSNNGLIAGIAAGAVTITATTVDGAKIDSAQVMVNLQNVNLSSFKINPSAIILAAGAEQQLNTEFSPSNANNTELTWSSNNPAIASVNERGFVTANGTGTAIITASTIEGKKTTSASVVVDKCSNYLYFNGVNQYVALPATVDNSIVLTNFTVEMWLNPSDTQNTNTFPIISNKDFSTGLNVGWALVHHGNGVFRFNMSNGTIRYDVTFTAPPRGVWSHLAIVVDRAASDVDIYINGVKRTLTRAYNLTALTATTGTVSTTLGLSLGQDGTGKYTRFWSGSMDELRIWNGTRTLQQIQNNQCKLNPINELNLIVYYNFNSFKRNVLYDLTEKANGLLLGMTDQNWLAAPICNNAGTLLDQTIAFAPFNDATTASPEISLQAISTSKLSIKYSSTDTTIASIRNNMLLIKKEGEVSITAAQSGNLVYNPATSVSQTLKVVAAAVAGIKTAKTVNSLVLYPNPAKNNFTIILDEGTLKQYRILSLNGLELKKQIKEVHVKESIIDVADLVTGTYILELVTTDNRIIHSKFSKI